MMLRHTFWVATALGILLGIAGSAGADEPAGLSPGAIEEDCGQLGDPARPVSARAGTVTRVSREPVSSTTLTR